MDWTENQPGLSYDDYRQEEIDMSKEAIENAFSVIEKALKDGEIEERCSIDENPKWTRPTMAQAILGDSSYEYRVKAEPREFWAVWDDKDVDNLHIVRAQLYPHPEYEGCVDHYDHFILVREVL
jgi:hypothetical protein